MSVYIHTFVQSLLGAKGVKTSSWTAVKSEELYQDHVKECDKTDWWSTLIKTTFLQNKSKNDTKYGHISEVLVQICEQKQSSQ